MRSRSVVPRRGGRRVIGDPQRVLLVLGTRPEAIKVAPVVLALREHPAFVPIVVTTGQHRELVDGVLDFFGIVAGRRLAVERSRPGLAHLTGVVLEGLDDVLRQERPELVVVQGDTTTTFAAALAAFYARVAVVHLEAGLRTGDRAHPFPEEVNRCLTTRLADLHLTPTPRASANLIAEGVDPATVVCTGNTVIDALGLALARDEGYADPRLAAIDDDGRRVLLVTVHRRESWGAPMARVGRALVRIARSHPDVLVVVPLHPNPVVGAVIRPLVMREPNVLVIDPPEYGDFTRLLRRSSLVLTDSGGIQEEAPSLGKPVLVVRETTERPEVVEHGTVELVGTDEDRIAARVCALLDDPGAYAAMARATSPYGDGRASERVVAALLHRRGLGPRPVEFAGSPSARTAADEVVAMR